ASGRGRLRQNRRRAGEFYIALPSLDDQRRGAFGRCPLDIGLDKAVNAGVPPGSRAAAEHDSNNAAIATVHRGNDVEPGGVNVARFDAVHAVHAPEEMVVIAYGL